MDLLDQWRRRSFGAAAVAVVAPAAAIAVALASGGLGGLGSLGQAFAGPELPAIAPLRQDPPERAGRLLARARQADAPTAVAAVPPSATAPTAAAFAPATGSPVAQQTPAADGPAPPDAPDPAPAPAQAPPAAATAAPTQAAPPPQPTTVVDQVTALTRDVPVAGGVVDSLARTVDGLTP